MSTRHGTRVIAKCQGCGSAFVSLAKGSLSNSEEAPYHEMNCASCCALYARAQMLSRGPPIKNAARLAGPSLRERQLEAAAKKAIPWLVLLGDFIGNGVRGDDNGRCDAIATLSAALGAADDVPRTRPGKER